MEKMRKTCLLVLGGDIKDAALFGLRLCEADTVIAADSGVRHLLRLGYMPEQVFGDLDSLTADEVARLKSGGCKLTVSPAEKNDTDGSFVIKEALGNGFEVIRIWGALGGRPDHSYANIMLLQLATQPEYSRIYSQAGKEPPEVVIEDGGVKIFLARSGQRLEGKKGEYVSIFALTPEVTGFEQTGLKYQPEGGRFTSAFPLGVSNEFVQDEAWISWSEGLVLCMQVHKQ